MLDRRGKSAEQDPDDEPMDLVEFIRKVDKNDVFPNSGSVSPTAAPPATRKVSAPAFGVLNGGTYQREEVQSPVQQQSLAKATGSPSAVPRKPLPSFRMKAFKNQRQTTFHSLDMHTDRSGEAQIAQSSLCQSNSSGLVDHGDDILRMPCIESMRISERPAAAVNGKTYQKVNSESAMHALKKKIQSVSNGGSKTDLTAQPTTKRVLHTVRQPDGSVVGFCTEEPLADVENPDGPTEK
ncbi:hypothetical protein AAVH_10113 [Aphelenchoides avenae]|nr:hypothetical protein AAVH_10113 [Aphelenchus avenae]